MRIVEISSTYGVDDQKKSGLKHSTHTWHRIIGSWNQKDIMGYDV
jgi:hypothetical protein